MEPSYRYFENRECQYYPCHKGISELNCLFCYCPLYTFKNCPGSPQYMDRNGKTIKVCTDCTYPHKPEHYDLIIKALKEH